jgi:hypothetical protein
MSENVVIRDETYDVEAIVVENEEGRATAFYPDAVRYNEQSLTEEQKAQARKNIGDENAKFTGASGEPVNQALVLTVTGSEDPHVPDGEYLIPYLNSNRKMKPTNLPIATTETDGAMSAEDKAKLNGIQKGADKTIVNQKVEKNSGLPVAAGAVRYELDKMQSKFEGKWVYEWDGNTEGRESVVGTYYTYYKVSDDTPTVEELSKIVEVMMYDPYRETLTVGYVDDYTTEHGYCELTAGGIHSTRVYYEGNSAGVSAGLYFHYTPRAQGSSSPGYTGLLTIGNNVTAGIYGGLNPSPYYYNVPQLHVDEYGRITQASNSVLPMADAKTNGLMSRAHYNRMTCIAYQGSTGRTIPAGATTYGDDTPAWTLYSLGAYEFPIIHVYGKYTDSNGTVHVIPIDWRLVEVIKSSETYQYNVYISIPEALAYDVVCILRSNYSTTSSGM